MSDSLPSTSAPFDLPDLIERCLRAEASADQQVQLQSALAADMATQRAYVRYLYDSVLLSELAESRDKDQATSLAKSTWTADAWSEIRYWIYHPATLAITVSTLLITTMLLGLALWTLPAVKPASGVAPPAFVARLVRTRNAVWSAESGVTGNQVTDLHVGQRLTLHSGLAEVRFDDGASVVLEGPAVLQLQSPSAADLHQGTLVAHIPADGGAGRQAKREPKFIVRTPAVILRDFGTEFAVAVDAAGRTEAHLYRGAVEIEPRTGRSAPVMLRPGQSLTIEGSGEAAGIVATDNHRFVHRIGHVLERGYAPPTDGRSLTIISDPRDGSIWRRIDDGQAGSLDTDLIAGSAAIPANWNGVALFELPDRKGKRIQEATLRLTVAAGTGSLPEANIDVWCLGYVSDPTLQPKWLLIADEETRTGEHLWTNLGGASPMRVADNLVPAGTEMALGDVKEITGAALVDCLNGLYDRHGARPGDFAVFRLNPDADVAGKFNNNNQPFASIRFGDSQRVDPDRRGRLVIRLSTP